MGRSRTSHALLAAASFLVVACGQSSAESDPGSPPSVAPTGTSDPTDNATATTTTTTTTTTTVDGEPGTTTTDAVGVVTTVAPAGQVTGPTTPGGTEVEPVAAPSPDPDAGPVPLCEDLPAITTDLVGSGTRIDEVFIRLIHQYGAENVDTFGGLSIDRAAGGVALIGFTDDPESHRAAIEALTVDDLPDTGSARPLGPDGPLREWDIPVDLVQVAYPEVTLTGLLAAIFEQARQSPLEVVSASGSFEVQRVSLDLAEPTPEGLDELAKVVDAKVTCVNGPLLGADRIVYQPGDEIDVIVRADAEGDYPAGLRVGCASDASYPLENVLNPTSLVDAGRDDLLDGIERTITQGGIELDDPPPPIDRWFLLDEADATALVYNPEGTFLRQLGLESTAAGWSFAGSSSGGGDCELLAQLPDGLGGVEWMLDPGAPVDPGSSTVGVLATEQACTGASEMGERLLGPQVVETDTEVLISFAVIPLTGPQECPGNPPKPVTIELDAPLGDRTVSEGRSTGLTLDELLTP